MLADNMENFLDGMGLETSHVLHMKKVEKTYDLSYVFWDRIRARNSA